MIKKIIPDGADETLLVIDGTTGQNGISQAKSFKEITDITGIVLTKLDGTAKGGIVLAIKESRPFTMEACLKRSAEYRKDDKFKEYADIYFQK